MLQCLQAGKISLEGWLDDRISFCTTSGHYMEHMLQNAVLNLIGVSGSFNRTNLGECKREMPDSK